MSILKPSDFNITKRNIPQDVADKIYLHHLIPLNRIAIKYPDMGIRVSARSGFRPVWWEHKKGRSGNSEHTYKNKGAVDLTCNDFVNRKDELLDLLIARTNYTRLAVYNSFIHCDYKPQGGERYVYNALWERQYKI